MKKYKCLNFGNCKHADTKEIFEIGEGEPLICPECQKNIITEVKGGPNKKLIGACVGGAALLGAALFALGGGDNDEEAAKIELNKEVANIFVGQHDTLFAVTTPDDLVPTLKWRSIDPSIAEVDDAGLVKGIAPGVTTIEVVDVDDKGLKAHCEYTVKEGEVIEKLPADTTAAASEFGIDSTAIEVGKVAAAGKEGKDEYEYATRKEEVHHQQSKATRKSEAKRVDSRSVATKKHQSQAKKTVASTVRLPYGKYSGETKNGRPEGLGRIVFTQSHIINSNDMKKRVAKPGESVQGLFVNGQITTGKHFDANGNLIQSLNFGVVD